MKPLQHLRPRLDYFVGLDIGQAQDFTAFAVLERAIAPDARTADEEMGCYGVRHLERLPLGTPYPDVCARMVKLFRDPSLAESTLIVDLTGVGRPVLDMLQRAGIDADIEPLFITAGHRATHEEGDWLVPRKDLVSTLQVLLQARRIKVPASLPEAEVLVQELTNFQAKVPLSATDALTAWREGAHDDLVLALAVAAWHGERNRPVDCGARFTMGRRPDCRRRW